MRKFYQFNFPRCHVLQRLLGGCPLYAELTDGLAAIEARHLAVVCAAHHTQHSTQCAPRNEDLS